MATNVGPQWEPSAEQVKAIHALWAKHYVSKRPPELADMGTAWVAFAEDVVRRQHEREDALTHAMASASIRISLGKYLDAREVLEAALAAHAKLDAPKEPTVREAVYEAQRSIDEGIEGGTFVAVPMEDWLAIKAAVDR